MARIRTIKTEFPQSESMGRISRDARLLFILLWTLCDDEGRSRGSARLLKGLLFPYDELTFLDIEAWLAELEQEGCIVRYVENASEYLQVSNWLNHQKIDKPSKSKIPPPQESSRILANPRERSLLDQGSRIKEVDQGRDQGSGMNWANRKTIRPIFEEGWMGEFRSLYPKRAGNQPWADAWKAAKARLQDGHTTAEFIDGARRYQEFCKATGKVGTEFVQRASTFLGPAKPFLQGWEIPKNKAEIKQDENIAVSLDWLNRRNEP